MPNPVEGPPPASVTVVVPAYNVERYLGTCVGAVRAQTAWSDCRVIVVDDGSTDATPLIAEQAAAEDRRISVIHQANQGPGPGAARNHGLDAVSTEYVLFCDGDDELTPVAVEALRSAMTHYSTDLAVGAMEQFPIPRSWLWTPYFVAGQRDQTPIEDVPLLVHNASTGNKMFRTEVLRRSGRRFAEGIHHQDTVVTVPAMLHAPRIALVGDTVQRYRKRVEGDSIMDSHYTRTGNYWDHLQVIETLSEDLDRLPPSRRPLLEAFLARSFQGFAWRAPPVLPPDRLPEFFERTRQVIARVSLDSIMTATRDASERAAYVAMLENDYATFAALDRHLNRLVAHDGSLYLDIPARSDQVRELVRTGATRALAENLRVTKTALQFDLRVRIQGARSLCDGLSGAALRFQDGTGTIYRVEDLALHPGEDSESRAEVKLPRKALHPGEYFLRLIFKTPTGQTARWVRRPKLPDRDVPAPAAVDEERVRLGFRRTAVLVASSNDRALLSIAP